MMKIAIGYSESLLVMIRSYFITQCNSDEVILLLNQLVLKKYFKEQDIFTLYFSSFGGVVLFIQKENHIPL